MIRVLEARDVAKMLLWILPPCLAYGLMRMLNIISLSSVTYPVVKELCHDIRAACYYFLILK